MSLQPNGSSTGPWIALEGRTLENIVVVLWEKVALPSTSFRELEVCLQNEARKKGANTIGFWKFNETKRSRDRTDSALKNKANQKTPASEPRQPLNDQWLCATHYRSASSSAPAMFSGTLPNPFPRASFIENSLSQPPLQPQFLVDPAAALTSSAAPVAAVALNAAGKLNSFFSSSPSCETRIFLETLTSVIWVPSFLFFVLFCFVLFCFDLFCFDPLLSEAESTNIELATNRKVPRNPLLKFVV